MLLRHADVSLTMGDLRALVAQCRGVAETAQLREQIHDWATTHSNPRSGRAHHAHTGAAGRAGRQRQKRSKEVSQGGVWFVIAGVITFIAISGIIFFIGLLLLELV
jgi:hypothetical protein